MIRIIKAKSGKLAGMINSGNITLRDVSALLWGLMMQAYAHKTSVTFTREIQFQTGETIEFDTTEDISASNMLKKLHEASLKHPIPDGYLASDEMYRGIRDSYGALDGGYFEQKGDDLYFAVSSHSDDEAHGIAEMYKALMRGISSNPDVMLNSVKRIGKAEEKKLTEFSKGEDMPYDHNNTWLDLFRERVLASPDSMAVITPDGRLTYKELYEASDRLASYIVSTGTPRGSFIAVMTDRVKEYVIAIIGIHKAGCAYVPIDISYNEKRINYMIDDSGTPLILDEETIRKAVEESSPAAALPGASPEAAAYMIYTSGSTGNPKGAIIPHKALMNFTLAVIKQNGLTDKDRVAAHKSFSFDAHIEDYFPPLSAGASIYIMPEEIRRDTGEIAAFLDKHRITGCGFTTSIGKLLITGHKLNVRYITCGGEALTGVTASNVQIINEYGPTEFTNDSTVFKLVKGCSYNVVPIGRPLPNCYCFVLDPFLNLLPVGVPGELCMAGVQTGIGYHNRPEKTEKVFMKCPFIKDERMYRTGDIVRFANDGNLEFIGRMDDQIKLNGYRIELGEIEALCGSYEGVKEASALIADMQGVKHLVLYYVVDDNAIVDEQRLRRHMESGIIPKYMYPEIYMKLDKMPRLPNGKINKRDMPAPELTINTENIAPANALETHMLSAAMSVLPGIDFGVTDDLFALGLGSLSAMKFIALVNNIDYHMKYRVGDIMRYRTIRAMTEGNRRVCFRYSRVHDPDKPILVFMYGVAPVSGTLKMLDLWCKVFNVYAVEPIDSHFNVLFAGPDYREINDMYYTILDNMIPGGMSAVSGFMGFSWGGFLSYTLAAAFAESKDVTDSLKAGDNIRLPFVLMGDTNFNECMSTVDNEMSTLPDLPDNFFEMTNGAITKQEALNRLKLIRSINSTIQSIPSYAGPVTLLDAALMKDDADRKAHERKLEVLGRYAKDVRIVEYPLHNHDDLFYDSSNAQGYLDEMKRIMNTRY